MIQKGQQESMVLDVRILHSLAIVTAMIVIYTI